MNFKYLDIYKIIKVLAKFVPTTILSIVVYLIMTPISTLSWLIFIIFVICISYVFVKLSKNIAKLILNPIFKRAIVKKLVEKGLYTKKEANKLKYNFEWEDEEIDDEV